jgi:4'-phosphopantetheinyl transferase
MGSSQSTEGVSCLSEQELLRAKRFRFAGDRMRWLLARSILRQLLALYLGRPPLSVEILRGPFGKPFVAEGGAGDGLRFNLSHSGNRAVYAFASGREVGIDIERGPLLRLEDLTSAGFLSGREIEELAALGGRGLHDALLRCWTRKEALIKATGEGLTAPLMAIEVPLDPGPHFVPRPLPGEEQPRLWSLVDVEIAPGYAACVAAEGPAQLSVWDWPCRESGESCTARKIEDARLPLGESRFPGAAL